MQASPANDLSSAVTECISIVNRIGEVEKSPESADLLLEQIAGHNQRHPQNGQLTSCHVMALYTIEEAARGRGDWQRARQMLARLDAVIATIPDNGDVTVGASGGQTVTGKNLLMTGLLHHVVGCVDGITDLEVAMTWLQEPRETLNGDTAMDRVNQRRVGEVLDAVLAVRA